VVRGHASRSKTVEFQTLSDQDLAAKNHPGEPG
jgi:hypothetical protein